MQLETCWRLEDGGMQNPAPTLQHSNVATLRSSDVLPSLHHPTSRYPNVSTSPGSIHRIFSIKAKISYSSRRRREDVRVPTRENVKARIGIEFSLFSLLFSFLYCFHLYGV